MTFRIRHPLPDDAPLVAALSRGVGAARPETEEFWRKAAEETEASRCFVAEDETTHAVIGYISARPDLPARPDILKFRLFLGVAEAHRGQGVASHLYQTLLDQAQKLGTEAFRTRVRLPQEPGLFAFWKQRGFREDHRMAHLERDITLQDRELPVPDNLPIVTLTEELRRNPTCAEEIVALENLCYADTPYYAGDPFVPATVEQFKQVRADPLILPDGFFLAVREGQYVGLSYVAKDPEDPKRLVQRYTGVHPSYRRQGVALVLKHAVLRYASLQGYKRTKTTTASPGMLALNLRLGYVPVAEELRLYLPL